MPYYGPWIELDVVDDPSAIPRDLDSPPTVTGAVFTSRVDSGDPVPMDLANFLVDIANTGGQSAATGETSAGASFTASHVNTQGLGTDTDPTTYFDTHDIQRGVQGSFYALTLDSLLWHAQWLTLEPPPDATGYEVETRMIDGVPRYAGTIDGVTVSATATWGLDGTLAPVEGFVNLNSVWPAPGEMWSIASAYPALDPGSGLHYPGQGSAAFDVHDYPVTEQISVSLASAPQEPGTDGLVGRVPLWACVRIPPGSSAVTYAPGEPGSLENGSASVTLNVNYDVVYHIRPPRIRWIYDTPQTVPIRQTSHRDDHHAGGAYQTWPPPKSEQESNRTFGSYI